MKKIWLFILLVSLSQQLSGQQDNQLNKILLESISLYFDYKSDLHSKVCENCEPYTFPYICKDGLPRDFPYDDLMHIDFLSLNNIECYPNSLRRKLNKGIGVWFIGIELINKQIIVTISARVAKRIKRDHLEISVGEWGVFTYENSCEKQEWLLVEAKYSGI